MLRKQYDEGGVRYTLNADYDAIFNMLSDLCPVIDTVFRKAQTENNRILTCQWVPLKDALLGLPSCPERAYVHFDSIQQELTELLTDLNALYTHFLSSPQGKISDSLTDRAFAKAMKAHTRKLKKIGEEELPNNDEIFLAGANLPLSVVTLIFADLHPDLQNTFIEWKAAVKNLTGQKKQKQTETDRARVERALSKMSPDLCEAYRKTADLADEAAAFGSLTVEDEYFIEQVHADYVPRILSAVEDMTEHTDEFSDKETIVSEALKQFRIIQAGIHRIIEKGIARKTNEMRAQTDFLTQKVLGDDSLTLHPGEAQAQLEATAEEAERIREALYQKHVAPILKAQQEEHNGEMEAKDKEYQQQLDRLLHEITRLEAANATLQNLVQVQRGTLKARSNCPE